MHRAVAVLRLLGKSEPLGVQAVARALDLVPSTALHVLRALAREGLVRLDPTTKRYSLDAGVLAIAGRWLRGDRFCALAQPLLDDLSRRHGVTAIGVQVSGLDYIVVVALAHAEDRVQLRADVGSRFPALVSATGRCIAAFGDHNPADLKSRFRALRWDRAPAFQEWSRDVREARRNGYALDVGCYMAGVTVVSTPVFAQPGRMTHALVAIGTTDQIEISGKDELIQHARSAAERLSAQMQAIREAVASG